MNRLHTIIAGLTIMCTGTMTHAQQGAAPRKLALLVGISQYERRGGQGPGWWNLESRNDVAAMRQVLMDHFGFAADEIVMRLDAQATRQGIIEAFQQHLIAPAVPGAVVVFHFSGHLQPVAADVGAGLEPSLVPFDYVSQSAADGAKTNLSASQLRELLAQLQQKMRGPDGKVAGSITCVIDGSPAGPETGAQPAQGRLRERGRGLERETRWATADRGHPGGLAVGCRGRMRRKIVSSSPLPTTRPPGKSPMGKGTCWAP